MGVITSSIFVDSWFAELGDTEKWLWVGLLALEDCGCIENSPELLRAKIFPRGNWKTRRKIEEALQKFERDGKIVFYREGRYFYLVNYLKHRGPGNHPKPLLPLPPWLEWRCYREDGSGPGKLIFHQEESNQVNNPLNNGLIRGYYQVNNQVNNGLITTKICKYNPVIAPQEGASNLNSCSENLQMEESQFAIRQDKKRQDKIFKETNFLNENPSFSEKTKETYPLSESQFSLSQSLKEKSSTDRSKEEPTPQMLRYPPPTLQEGLEAIPDPEKRQRVREGIDEFLKTHCV